VNPVLDEAAAMAAMLVEMGREKKISEGALIDG